MARMIAAVGNSLRRDSNNQTRKTLTDKTLRGLRPAKSGQRYMIWDAVVPGFGVRVSDRADPQGKAAGLSFVVMRRLPGEKHPTRVTIGRYHPDAFPLAKARERAREALGMLAGGIKPAEEKELRQREKAVRAAQTFAAVAEKFIKLHVSPKLRTGRAVEQLIRRELIPILGEKHIGEIRRRDIVALIEDIVARGNRQDGHRRLKSGGEHAARHTLAALRKLFNWALARDIDGVDANPCGRIKVADFLGAPKVRDRVLTDAELRLVWRAAEDTPYPFGPLVRALLLTGQRLSEIAEARWSEIDNGKAMLTVPAERMKGKIAHAVPLTPRVTDLLESLPRFVGGGYIFTTTGGQRPISGYSKMKTRFDRTIAELIARDRAELVAVGLTEEQAAEQIRDVAHFTLHDLRRTVRTGLAAAGVSVFVGELVIGHRQTGIHAVYDLHRYDAEKREALEKWAARLAAIVEPPPDNVVVLPERERRA